MSDLLFFIANLSFNLEPLLSNLLDFLLFHFPLCHSLILLDSAFSILIEFLDIGLLRLEANFVLLCTYTRLSCFLLFCEYCHLLNSLFFEPVLFFHPVDSVLCFLCPHIVILHLLDLGSDSFLVFLLETHNFSSLLLGLFNFFPCLHLLLLEKRNTIGEKLGISLHFLTFSS